MHEIKKEGKQKDEITTWVFEGFTPTAKLVNGKSYSIISDYLGTPLQAIDSEGKLIWERELDIYGRIRKETKETANFVPFLFQGQYLDIETELVYNYKRYYSQETGAYISQDPIGLAGGNPTIYGYVHDPNTWIDPLGLSACHDSGNKGRDNARTDIEVAGLTIIGEEVTLNVNGGKGNIRADFLAVDANGNIHIFEAKNGNSSYTTNQQNAGVFDKNSLSNKSGGGLDLSKGKTSRATIKASDRKVSEIHKKQKDNTSFTTSYNKGTEHNITFHTLWYNAN
ncbi:RHS repeat-associated protein [Treponema pedis]